MAFTGHATGNLAAEPEIRVSQSGVIVLEMRIASTPRRKDKTTGEWADDGDPVWLRVAFFGVDAERIAEMGLQRGAKVSVEGTLRRRVYEKRDGGVGESLELVGARFLGIIPKGRAGNAPQRSQEAAGGAYGGGQYTGQGQQFPQPQTGAQSADVWGGQPPF